MTEDEFCNLDVGDIVQGALGEGYVITGNYGDWKIATKTLHICNPIEWKLIAKRGPVGTPPKEEKGI